MRIALVVPGGVDRSGEYRVIPALLALISELTRVHQVEVVALRQESRRADWSLAGARIHNIGQPLTRLRALQIVRSLHRQAPLDVIQAIWSGSCGLVAVVAGSMLGVPALVHVAGGELVALREIGYGGAFRWRSRLREHWTLRRAAAVTAASAPMIELLRSAGVAAERVALGVDPREWPLRPPVRRDPSRRAQLIHVASLNAVKDQTCLLQALAQLRLAGVDFHLDVVGEDTLQGRVQRLAAELQLSTCITFHGFVPQRRLRPLIAAADLMVHSSRHETGPLVILEAAMTGVPTVGTAVGHLAEWTPAAALAVPVADPRALATAILRVLNDESLRLRLAQAAQDRACIEDAGHSARAFTQIYARVIAAARQA
jgi:glycosyltransferase involved in cell wall biosynthesis